MLDRYVDILKLREEILSLPYSMPVVEADNAKEEKHDNSVDTADNGIEAHIGCVDILKLREEVLSPPLSTPEPNETKEVEMLDNIYVLTIKQVEATLLPSWRNITHRTIATFGKGHRRWIMTLIEIEEVFVTWTVVGLTNSAQVAHRKARKRRKKGLKLSFRTL